ncbi:STAS domain-containing protein [Streptomyces sp. NPDC096176]|uniref:STAS domain-containing protein n=1 Tax=Streptomyces sp. NPDC096176 TaxID=3366079 RepID=UPI003801D79B
MSTAITSLILAPKPLTAPTTTAETSADSAAPGDITIVRSYAGRGAVLHLHLQGDIDHLSAAPLRDLLAGAAADYSRLTVDASRVTFADSALLRALELWPRRGRRTFSLERPSRPVRRLLTAASVAARRMGRSAHC